MTVLTEQIYIIWSYTYTFTKEKFITFVTNSQWPSQIHHIMLCLVAKTMFHKTN